MAHVIHAASATRGLTASMLHCSRISGSIRCIAASSIAHDGLQTCDLEPSSPLSKVPRLVSVLRRLGRHGLRQERRERPEAYDTTSLVSLKRSLEKGRAALPMLLGAAPVVMVSPSVWEMLAGNYVFVVGFWGWFMAQFLKIFTKWYKTGRFSLRAFVDSGGMPSSHSALCSAVTTAVAIQQGLGSTLFAICTCFSVIVMYDAMGVRRHAGLQAEVLNAVVEDLLEGHPVSERKLKEVLGHTPRQVIAGAVLGITIGLLFPRPI